MVASSAANRCHRRAALLAEPAVSRHSKSVNVPDLVDRFRRGTLSAAELHKGGRTTAGNRRADASHKAFVSLTSSDEGRQALLALLHDDEMVVQIDVAGRLLPDPAAWAALEEWAERDADRGRQARFVMKYWRP